MVLKKLRKTFGAQERMIPADKEEYIEVDVAGGVAPDPGHVPSSVLPTGKMGIVIENVTDFSDTEKVLKYLREGKIILLKIKTLREKDLGELKRAVERLKRTTVAQNGDIVGVEQDWLLLVPSHVTVHK